MSRSSTTGASARRAFSLVDVAVSLACAGTLLALALTGLSGSRHATQLAECAERLGTLGADNAQFALSHNGLMAGLTWQTGGANSSYPDLTSLQNQPGLGNAHAAQAIDILRRRGRPDIPVINAWIPDIGYWSLALVDFTNRPLTNAFNICPSHDNLGKWRRQPAAFDQGRFMPAQPPPSAINKRWPYSSTYTLSGGSFDVSQSILTTQAAAARLSNAQQHNQFFIPGNAVIGPSAMSTVAFPSQKVHVFDANQRHFSGPLLYFAYAASRQPILFFDGSVAVRTSQDALTPWSPNSPSSPFPQTYQYAPSPWEPSTASGQAQENVTDRYRWTRSGLLGRDFNP